MKQIILLITFFALAGCSPKFNVAHVPYTHADIHVVNKKKVPVEITKPVTIPERDHTGEQTAFTDEETTLTWDWEGATTEVNIQPRPAGTGNGTTREAATYKVKTTVKAQTITVTLRDTVVLWDSLTFVVKKYPGIDSFFTVVDGQETFKETLPNDFTCVALAPPATGSKWWTYLIYIVGAMALVFWAGRKDKKKKTA